MAALFVLSALVVLALASGLVIQTRRLADAHRLESVETMDTSIVDVITIEIRNHADLAAERTGLARPIHRVAPGLIRSLVHKETLKLLRVELADQGVDADVRLRRLPTGLGRAMNADASDQPDEPAVASG